MSGISEKQLIEFCLKNDRKAQKELYDLYSRRMMGVCLRYSNDTETAKDMLQDGFIKLFTHLKTFQFNGSFEGWMRRIFVNTCLEHLRKNDVLHDAADLEHAAAPLSESNYGVVETLSARDLMKIIGELPKGFRMIFNMYEIEGYSHKEIADALGITESTSRSQLTRAKQILKNRIQSEF
jgi:RNA polymerase sigma-70 factor (ECF subfamily)